MKLVLLSGGSGKRLWPLSNDTRSKQFLKVLVNESNEKQSMVQRVWGQVKDIGLEESTVIATSKLQRDMIYSQLGENVQLIIEPERRDTFPAIILSASYLYSLKNVSEEEVIVVLPVDPYVKNDFFKKINELENALNQTNADLALIGVKPTYPSSKYGYIIPETVQEDKFLRVSRFTEKPSEEKAKEFINMNALWNCGVFAFKLKYVLDIIVNRGLPLEYNQLINLYRDLPKISFDYAVVEQAQNITVLPYDGEWKDLGTWNTLTEEMSTQKIGKGIIDDNSQNTHIINELDIPIIVTGANDLVIAASPDGILVADKASSPKVKNLINNLNQPPMYEERLWGWSRVLDYVKYENGQEMVTKRICIHEGKNSSYHYHNFREEVWTIVRGEGELIFEENITRVKSGDTVHIPVGKKHGIKAFTELEFIEVQTGIGISDEDFVRLFYKWEDILSHFSARKPIIIS